MAFAFTTGTINQPDAGSVGLAMAEKIRDDVVVHAAWELVEEFTAASGLVRWYVFKCLAAQSGLPNDFFIVMGRTLGDGSLRFAVCEGYDSSTHTMTKFCIANATSTQFLYDGLGRVPQSYILGTAAFTGTGLTPSFVLWAPSGTSTKWWLIVTEDGFTVAFNGASNGVVHCGVYIPLTVLTIDMPIHAFGTLGPAAWSGHITRNPAVANLNHWGTALQTESSGSVSGGPVLGFQGLMTQPDALQGGQRAVAELGITMNLQFGTGSPNSYPTMGWALGKVKRMRYNLNSAPAGFAFGDAYVLQGRLWVPYLPSDARMWDTGVAA